jgi:hypothetical protein
MQALVSHAQATDRSKIAKLILGLPDLPCISFVIAPKLPLM